MAPSLTEIFNARFPEETRDCMADEEDLWGSKLTFNKNVPIQKGVVVKVVEVNVIKGTHVVELESEVKREFSNNEDIYVETS
jgi:hypothetical protein